LTLIALANPASALPALARLVRIFLPRSRRSRARAEPALEGRAGAYPRAPRPSHTRSPGPRRQFPCDSAVQSFRPRATHGESDCAQLDLRGSDPARLRRARSGRLDQPARAVAFRRRARKDSCEDPLADL
jgi:hypothetical protein